MIRAFQRPTQRYYLTLIRTALKTGQRPTAAILRDPYAMYRDHNDIFWRPDPVRHTQWTDWDFLLAEAVAIMDGGMIDDGTGQPRWLAEDPDVDWKVGTVVNFAEQDLAEAYEKLPEGSKGYHLYLHSPYKKGEFWTAEEWLQNVENEEKQMERGAPSGGHAPSAAENQARRAAQQERIRKALEGADDTSVE